MASDLKCYPVQTGFTVEGSTLISEEFLSFHQIGVGMKDENILIQSCSGWFGAYLPAFFVGLFYRLLGGGLLHVIDRSKQFKSSFSLACKDRSFFIGVILYTFLIMVSLCLAIYFVVR